MKYHVEFDIDFKRNPYKGLYIVFEGVDGSGKTTQAKILAAYLKEKKSKVVLTKEPTENPPLGILIHDFIKGKIKFPPVALQYLFAADREIHQKELVEPSLQKGKIVVSDRYFWSSVAYGILDKMENTEEFNDGEILLVSQSILSIYHQFIVPDITFYIKVSENTAIKRLSGMSKKKEYYETKEKLKKIKEGYDWLAEKFPEEVTVIDGEKSVKEVTEQIIKKLDLRF